MGSPLGGASSSPVTWTVKNTGATDIERGHIVALNAVASPEYIGAEQILIPVQKATSTAGKYIGVANAYIPVGGVGVVTACGPVLCQTNDSVTYGDAIRPDTTAGDNEHRFETWATSGTKYGIALETDHTGKTTEDFALGAGGTTRYWAHCLVNFLSDGGFGDA